MKIPVFLRDIIESTNYWKRRCIKVHNLKTKEEIFKDMDRAPKLELGYTTSVRVGIVKEMEDIDGYIFPMASWPKYERFCKNNNISYGILDVTKSDWMEQVAEYDIIIWHTGSSPAIQEMAETKIYMIEKVMGKLCFPSFHEVWQYENKIRAAYLYEYYKLPSIPTFVTNNREDAINKIEETKFPIIYKLSTGSGSAGVFKFNSKSKAIRIINKIFKQGNPTYWGYIKTKDEFYMQEFVDDADYDLRIMMIDNMAFGYYRYPNKGDYKASGAGNYEKKEIPNEALILAHNIKEKLKARQIGVDLLFSKKKNKYYIIETSTFNRIDTPEQLVINGVPGYYDLSDLTNIKFKEGRFWIQELTLKSVINDFENK